MEAQPVYMLTQEQLEDVVRSMLDRVEKRIDNMLSRMQQDEKEEYTYEEFCEKYHVCQATIRNWKNNKIVDITALGKKRYVRIIDEEFVRKWREKQLLKNFEFINEN